MLKKTLESPLDSKEIKPVSLKRNQSWILIGRTDAEALIFWSPDSLEDLPWLGKSSSQKEKRATEDEMVGWHHQFNGHEPGQTLGDGEGQGSLACYSPWGHEQWNMIWQLNNNQRNQPWMFTGRTDGEAEAPILWPPDVNSRFTGEDSDVGKDPARLKAKGEEGGRGWDV